MSHNHCHLIAIKAKTPWRKDGIFYKWYRQNWMSTCRRMKLHPYLLHCTKIRCRWIKSLNFKSYAMLKLLEENIAVPDKMEV